MARYLSLHTLACLTRQGAEQLTERLTSAEEVEAVGVQVNLLEGKMLVEFEAPDREVLEKWLRSRNFHYDWLLRVELELRDDRLQPVE